MKKINSIPARTSTAVQLPRSFQLQSWLKQQQIQYFSSLALNNSQVLKNLDRHGYQAVQQQGRVSLYGQLRPDKNQDTTNSLFRLTSTGLFLQQRKGL